MCQVCPPSQGFCATQERALRAQAQEFRAEEGCDVSKYTSKWNGHRKLSLSSDHLYISRSVPQFLWSWGRAIPLHTVHMQWKIQVRAAPRHNNLEMEMEEPDWARQLLNTTHKPRGGNQQSCLSSRRMDISVLFQQKIRLSTFVHSKCPGQGGGISAQSETGSRTGTLVFYDKGIFCPLKGNKPGKISWASHSMHMGYKDWVPVLPLTLLQHVGDGASATPVPGMVMAGSLEKHKDFP